MPKTRLRHRDRDCVQMVARRDAPARLVDRFDTDDTIIRKDSLPSYSYSSSNSMSLAVANAAGGGLASFTGFFRCKQPLSSNGQRSKTRDALQRVPCRPMSTQVPGRAGAHPYHAHPREARLWGAHKFCTGPTGTILVGLISSWVT
jgi:hypothetical protein